MSEKISTGGEEQENDVLNASEPLTAEYESDIEAEKEASSPAEENDTAENESLPLEHLENNETELQEQQETEPVEEIAAEEEITAEPAARELLVEPTEQTGESAEIEEPLEEQASPFAQEIKEEASGIDVSDEALSEQDEQPSIQSEQVLQKSLPSAEKGYVYHSKTEWLKNRFVISIVMLLSSIAIILVALFAPLSHSTVSMSKGVAVDIEFTGIDSFKLFYYSAQSLDETQIQKTQLYKDTKALSSKTKVNSKNATPANAEVIMKRRANSAPSVHYTESIVPVF
jgi:hypothetical protein